MKMVSPHSWFPRRHGWAGKGGGLNFRCSEVWQVAAGTFAHMAACPPWRSPFVATEGETPQGAVPGPGEKVPAMAEPGRRPLAGPRRLPAPSTSRPGRRGLGSAFASPAERSTCAVAGRLPRRAAKAGTVMTLSRRSRTRRALGEDGLELPAPKQRGARLPGAGSHGPSHAPLKRRVSGRKVPPRLLNTYVHPKHNLKGSSQNRKTSTASAPRCFTCFYLHGPLKNRYHLSHRSPPHPTVKKKKKKRFQS